MSLRCKCNGEKQTFPRKNVSKQYLENQILAGTLFVFQLLLIISGYSWKLTWIRGDLSVAISTLFIYKLIQNSDPLPPLGPKHEVFMKKWLMHFQIQKKYLESFSSGIDYFRLS